MGFYDNTNYTNSLLISYLVSYEIMHVMSDFLSQISVAHGPERP